MLSAALSMIDAEGVEALSMRKLGQVLNRDPMRVYRHTKSKAALLDAVAELVLDNLSLPPVVDGRWEDAVRHAAHSFRETALAHPRMVTLLINRPLTVSAGVLHPAGLLWVEGLLALLAEAGFDDETALHAFRFLTSFLAGHVVAEVQELLENRTASALAIQLGLQLLPHHRFPRIRALAPGLVTHNGALEFALGLDLVLMGLRSQLESVSARTPLKK